METVAGEAGVNRVLLYGADRSGSAVQWLTGWPVTREAVVVTRLGGRDIMFVQFSNHVPLATGMATAAEVRRGGRAQRLHHALRGLRRVG